MTESEHRKELGRAWANASSELRHRHDAEFHQILSAMYESKGLVVTKRTSRAEAKQKRLASARALVESDNRTSP